MTNPPIDAIREESSPVPLSMQENRKSSGGKTENCSVLKINNPILTNTDMLKIKNEKPGFKVAVVPITYYKSTKLERALGASVRGSG